MLPFVIPVTLCNIFCSTLKFVRCSSFDTVFNNFFQKDPKWVGETFTVITSFKSNNLDSIQICGQNWSQF